MGINIKADVLDIGFKIDKQFINAVGQLTSRLHDIKPAKWKISMCIDNEIFIEDNVDTVGFSVKIHICDSMRKTVLLKSFDNLSFALKEIEREINNYKEGFKT